MLPLTFGCAGPPDQLAAKEHLLSSAFKRVDKFKDADQAKISSQCAYVYERYSVPWTNLPKRKSMWNQKRIHEHLTPRIVTKHLDTLPSHKYFKFHRLGASTRHSKAKAAYLRAAQRECGPEIHRHAAWFQLFFSPGGIMTTYHSCFFHSCYMNHWNTLQTCRSKLQFLFSSGCFRWNFYREGSVGGLRMALSLSLLLAVMLFWSYSKIRN
jgi:hypothetical protein